MLVHMVVGSMVGMVEDSMVGMVVGNMVYMVEDMEHNKLLVEVGSMALDSMDRDHSSS